MNRFKVYLVTMNTNIEFNNGEFTGWNEHGTPMYCYNDIKDAQSNIYHQKKKETENYRDWLNTDIKVRGCFIHHHWDIKTMDVF